MAKFIELHYNEGEDTDLVNVDHIISVSKFGGGVELTMSCCGRDEDGYPKGMFSYDESYTEVRQMIAAATGGITMPPREGKHDSAGV